MTQAQTRALKELWPVFGVDDPGRSGHEPLFGSTGATVLEIGFGDGESLATLAATHRDINYLGIEVHEPGIGHLLLLAQRFELENLKIVRGDAAQILPRLPATSLGAVNLFFPDPWPKKRHHKRRLVQHGFLQQVHRLIEPKGLFHFASDWPNYVEHVIEVSAQSNLFAQLDGGGHAHGALAQRPETKFERRGLRLGHTISDLYFERA